MDRRPLLLAAGATATAAVAGNAFVGDESMAWFRGLDAPRWQLPMPGFLAVGAVYYAQLGTVLARSLDRGDRRSVRLALVVLAGNEAWNAVFFGGRSARNGFLGVAAFLVPLAALQSSVAGDPVARRVLAPYTAYVLAYDLPWTYCLWRRNRAAG